MTDVLSPTSLAGVFLLTPRRIEDERGWFVRTLEVDWLRDAGLPSTFVHHNQSRSAAGVLRGLHVRSGPGETKLVRCARGSVVDHVVDTRPWSATFGHTARFVLDDEDLHHLYLPPHVAHGFQVVSPVADVCYLHAEVYEPGTDLSIAWDDPDLALDWPIRPPIVSAKDAAAPRLRDLDLAAAFERAEPPLSP